MQFDHAGVKRLRVPFHGGFPELSPAQDWAGFGLAGNRRRHLRALVTKNFQQIQALKPLYRSGLKPQNRASWSGG
jgi:hypothetical protein